MTFETVDKAVIQNYTNLISHRFGFVLTDRNNFNNLVINTSLPYKNNTVKTNNTENKFHNPKTYPTRMLKFIITAEYVLLYIGRYKTLHVSCQYKP